MYGLVRRDSEGRTHPGFTTYILLSVGVFVICFYVLIRFNAQPEPKMNKKELERRLVPTNVSSLNAPLNTWQVSELSENGENVIVREKEKKNILSSRSSIFSPIKSATFKADATGVANRLNFQEIKQLRGDNGGTYVKSDFGVYALNVQAGTELKGKRNSFVVGDDLKLYRIHDGGKRSLVNEALLYKLTDPEGRFYIITDSIQLRRHTPGGPERFVGPDNTAYNIFESGDMEKAQDNTLVSSISGEGEFMGSDDRRYIVIQGLLLAPTSENVSFSNGSIGGSGYFTGPDGKTYMLGEDGQI